MIKRLIFDVDGTLITGIDFVSSIERSLKRINLYSPKNIEKFLEAIKIYESKYNNYNVSDYLYHLGSYLGTKLNDDFLNIFFDELKYCIPKENKNLVNTIEKLSKKYELVLLTNYFKESQLNRLNNMNIGKYFIECHGEKLIKPNKMAYIKACGKNKPDECIMIGDNLDLDIKNAQRFGLNAIYINYKNTLIDEEIIIVNQVEDITIELIETIENNRGDKSE